MKGAILVGGADGQPHLTKSQPRFLRVTMLMPSARRLLMCCLDVKSNPGGAKNREGLDSVQAWSFQR
jgi:hypothetical protein